MCSTADRACCGCGGGGGEGYRCERCEGDAADRRLDALQADLLAQVEVI